MSGTSYYHLSQKCSQILNYMIALQTVILKSSCHKLNKVEHQNSITEMYYTIFIFIIVYNWPCRNFTCMISPTCLMVSIYQCKSEYRYLFSPTLYDVKFNERTAIIRQIDKLLMMVFYFVLQSPHLSQPTNLWMHVPKWCSFLTCQIFIVVFNKGLKILKTKMPPPPGTIYISCFSNPPSHMSFLPYTEFFFLLGCLF